MKKNTNIKKNTVKKNIAKKNTVEKNIKKINVKKNSDIETNSNLDSMSEPSFDDLIEIEVEDDAIFVDLEEEMKKELEAVEKNNLSNDYAGTDDIDLVKEYFKSIMNAELLSVEEEKEIGQRILEGDEDAINKMVTCNLRLVVHYARKYLYSGMDILDLIQDGNIGLMKAAEKYDVTKGFRFSTYATWWIVQAIRRGIDNNSRSIRLPSHIIEKSNKIHKVEDTYAEAYGRKATIEEIAKETGLTKAKINEVKNSNVDVVSINKTVGEDNDTDMGEILKDEKAADPEKSIIKSSMGETLRELVDRLPEREREVIRLRHGLDDGIPHTLEYIGDKLHVTRERVRQIETRGLILLRKSSAFNKNSKEFKELYEAS